MAYIKIDYVKVNQLSKELGVPIETILGAYADFAKIYDDEQQIFALIESAIRFANAGALY